MEPRFSYSEQAQPFASNAPSLSRIDAPYYDDNNIKNALLTTPMPPEGPFPVMHDLESNTAPTFYMNPPSIIENNVKNAFSTTRMPPEGAFPVMHDLESNTAPTFYMN